jgi:hypothetical protein
MLGINPETVCFVISRGREFHAKEEVVLPDTPDSPSEDWALQVLADHAGDDSLREVRGVIDELEPEQQVALVALMWVGRGDYDSSEWDSALEEARGSWTPRTSDYLMSTPLVADYLEEGLSQFGYDCGE